MKNLVETPEIYDELSPESLNDTKDTYFFEEVYNEYLKELKEQDILREQVEEENRLYEYWEKYIKGHSSEMFDIGNDICMMGYDLYHTLPEEERVGYIFDSRYDDFYIRSYQKKNPMWSIEYLKECYELANHWSFYSDWYKDVYGFRPRSL